VSDRCRAQEDREGDLDLDFDFFTISIRSRKRKRRLGASRTVGHRWRGGLQLEGEAVGTRCRGPASSAAGQLLLNFSPAREPNRQFGVETKLGSPWKEELGGPNHLDNRPLQ